MQKDILSGRQLRTNNIFWNSVHPSSHSPTSGIVSGSVLMYLDIKGIDKKTLHKKMCLREIFLTDDNAI